MIRRHGPELLFASLLIVLASFTAVGQIKPQVNVIGAATDALKLSVSGDATISYRVETSSDLEQWEPLVVTTPSTGIFPTSTQFEFADREFMFGGQKFYRAVPANVLLHNVTPDIIVSDPLLSLYEGGSASFSVRLSKAPPGNVTVQAARTDGSTNILINGSATLVFGPSNWSTAQAISVSAGLDSDFQDSEATLTLSASNLASQIVRVLAVDNNVDDEFVGPFASWKDLKRDFGAKGDGKNDDTGALQNALRTLQPNSTNYVLYIPAGTYRITQTLDFSRISASQPPSIMIIGEDPSITQIRWDGPTNGVMLIYGAWYSKVSRLTFDGAAKAKTAIAHDAPFSTHNEFSDMVFKDLSFGIEAGTPNGGGNAETAVERCQFIRCALAGISLQNPNSLDWFIWNTEFDDCGLGVSNIYGAGNFQVYESLFRGSTQADMSIGNAGFFSARNNVSIGSAAFFTATPIPSCGLITLQGNTVVQPRGLPIQVGDFGPLLLLDNWVQDYQGAAANIQPSAGFFSIGNTFTVSNAIPSGFSGPSGIRLDDVVTSQNIPLALPRLPGALKHFQGQVIDLPGPTNATGIQAAINQAAALGGVRPVVHLPAGQYPIDQTLTIPSGSDLQLIGDGGVTALHWTGTGQGPMIQIFGPGRATLRDFNLFGPATNSMVDGVTLEHCDQAGGRAYFDQLDVYHSQQVGLLVEGLTNTAVNLPDFYHSGNQVSVRVSGALGVPNYNFNPRGGLVSVFGGGSAGNVFTYDVRNGGKLLVRDVWYEADGVGSSPSFMLCTNSGWFTLNGGEVALSQSRSSIPAVNVSNFVGRVTFLTTDFAFTNSTVSVNGQGTGTAVMLLGTLNGSEPTFGAPAAQTSLLQSFQTPDGQSYNPFFDTGTTDPNFLRDMLAQTRNSRPAVLVPISSSTSDARIHRVIIEATRNAVHLSN